MSGRLVIGVTGASGPQYAIGLLRALRAVPEVETHVIVSAGADRTLELEAGLTPGALAELADVAYDERDLAAGPSSGSFKTLGMVVVPCSMKTLAAVAGGYTDGLIARAADVTLKERRRLVLVTRETPLSLVHLRNMCTVTEAGATVLPPVPGFYARPQSIDDVIAQTCGKVLDQFGLDLDLFPRWSGPDPGSS
ncbi:MAG TPA: UbiX family flavin prenyltransferase [Solirubrobacterales bacterium]|nr:UbiX family flavin prenyltransferase [Solirubrobacterales bacterium]